MFYFGRKLFLWCVMSIAVMVVEGCSSHTKATVNEYQDAGEVFQDDKAEQYTGENNQKYYTLDYLAKREFIMETFNNHVNIVDNYSDVLLKNIPDRYDMSCEDNVSCENNGDYVDKQPDDAGQVNDGKLQGEKTLRDKDSLQDKDKSQYKDNPQYKDSASYDEASAHAENKWMNDSKDASAKQEHTVHELDYSKGTVYAAATCTCIGTTSYPCKLCPQYVGVSDIPALGHDFCLISQGVGSDCLTKGTDTYKCSRCEEIKTVDNELLGEHSWETVSDEYFDENIWDYVTVTRTFCTRCNSDK